MTASLPPWDASILQVIRSLLDKSLHERILTRRIQLRAFEIVPGRFSIVLGAKTDFDNHYSIIKELR